MTNDDFTARMRLSAVQILYLQWASQGKDPCEVAKVEGANPSEVHQRLNDAVRLLGKTSIGEAIDRARFLNLI